MTRSHFLFTIFFLNFICPSSSSTIVYPIDELITLFSDTKCTYDVFGFCEKGTVVPDPWTDYALKTQRFVARNLPLNIYPFLGSHNSFNDRADGYGFGDLLINSYVSQFDTRFIWAQQEYTMTDQLNLGIRELHLDPHWFNGELRLCHGAGNISFLNDFFEKYHIRYDSEQLGCSPFDRSYADGLLEIKEWLDENPTEVLLIHQDDTDADTFNISTIPIILSTFGSSIFFPSILYTNFSGEWPTVDKLVEIGTRIIFQAENNYNLGNVLFAPFLEPGWPNNCLNNYTYTVTDWSVIQGESQLVGPFYNGPRSCGLLTPTTIPSIIDHELTVIELDQISPKLMSSFVWSWALDQPSSLSNACPLWNVTDGRWWMADCSDSYGYLCRDEDGLYVSSFRGTWNATACSPNNLSVPYRAFENTAIISDLSLWMALPFEMSL